MNPGDSSSTRPQGHGRLVGLSALALLGAALVTPIRAEPPRQPAGLEPWTEGLALLHASRTDEALEWFLDRKSRHPDDVCGFYFPALVYIHFDVEELTPEQEGERGQQLLEDGIDAAERRIDSGSADSGVQYCLGALYGLRAEHRLRRSKYLGAAFDAKRARRVMLDLLKDWPSCVDCRFWVGSYDYFADVLPGAIKFFRSLLFFPKGNKERGLATLREVAEHGTLDRFNALWMLYTLYRGFEKQPQQALEILEHIREDYPEYVDASLVLGGYYLQVATPPDRARGIAVHLELLERVAALGGDHGRRLTRQVRVSLARAYLGDLRAEAAIETVRPVVAATRGRKDREIAASLVLIRSLNHAGRHDEALRVFDDLRKRYSESPQLETLERVTTSFGAESSRTFHLTTVPWRRGRQGEVEPAEAALRDLLARGHPAGLVHFALAGMYFDVGDKAEADKHYRLAAEAGIERPTSFIPIAYLRLGNLADLRGERRGAKRYYRKASGSAGEHEWVRGLAKHYLKEPFTGVGGLRFP
jgi:pentatricopeptide repeat protein